MFQATAARRIAVRPAKPAIAKALTVKVARGVKPVRAASRYVVSIARRNVRIAIVTVTAVIVTAEMMEVDENDYTRLDFNR